MKYSIESRDGTDFGVWEGATPAAAWEAMVAAAGGASTDADGNPTEGTIDDWIVTPTLPLGGKEKERDMYRFDDAYERIYEYSHENDAYIFIGTYVTYSITRDMSDAEKVAHVNADN